MNNFFIIILFFLIGLQCKSQVNLSGIFQYKRERPLYEERLILHQNGTFEFFLKMDMGIHYKNTGNWQQRNGYLILDSYPHKEKLIVWESYDKKKKNLGIEVLNKEEKNYFYYHLTAILSNNDTLVFRDQYIETNTKEKIISFWITNTVGLKSSEYKIKSSGINTIKVLFEDNRIFENENWKIIDFDKIQPRGLDGNICNYFLERLDDPIKN